MINDQIIETKNLKEDIKIVKSNFGDKAKVQKYDMLLFITINQLYEFGISISESFMFITPDLFIILTVWLYLLISSSLRFLPLLSSIVLFASS